MVVIVAQQGQALVEFALVLPILLILAFGIVQLSDVGVARLRLEQAAAEGARIGALTNDDELIRDSVAAVTAALDQTRLEVEIDPGQHEVPRTGDPRGSLLRVLLRYRPSMLLPGLAPLELRTTSARRIEWTP